MENSRPVAATAKFRGSIVPMPISSAAGSDDKPEQVERTSKFASSSVSGVGPLGMPSSMSVSSSNMSPAAALAAASGEGRGARESSKPNIGLTSSLGIGNSLVLGNADRSIGSKDGPANQLGSGVPSGLANQNASGLASSTTNISSGQIPIPVLTSIDELQKDFSLQLAESEDRASRHIHQLQAQLLQEELDRSRAIDDKRFLQARLVETKEKHQGLIKEKLELQRQLLDGEARRLELSQALISVQQRLNQSQTESAQQGFQQKKVILQIEQELTEAQRQLAEKTALNDDLEKQLRRVELEKLAKEDEIGRLQDQLKDRTQVVESLTKDKEDMSLSILNLCSEKDDLTERLKNTAAESAASKSAAEQLTRTLGDAKNSQVELEKQLTVAQESMNKERDSRIRKEIEIEKLKADMEIEKAKHEKELAEKAKRENEVDFESKRATLGEIDKLLEQLKLTTMQRDDALKQSKSVRRQLVEVEESLKSSKASEAQVLARVDEMLAENARMRDDLFGEMTSLLAKTEGSANSANQKDGPGSTSLAGKKLVDATVVDEVVTRLTDITVRSSKKEKALLSERRRLVNAVRLLQSKLVWMRRIASDWAPTEHTPDVDRTLDEMDRVVESTSLLASAGTAATIPSSGGVLLEDVNSTNVKLESLEAEAAALKADLAKERLELSKHRVEHNSAVTKYELDLAQMNVELVSLRQLKQENESLSQLVKGQEKLHKEITSMKAKSGDSPSNGAAALDTLEGATRRCIELEKQVANLTEQISRGLGGPAAATKVAFLEKAVRQLEQERSSLIARCTLAEEQLDHLQSQLLNYVQHKTLDHR